jgi:hypothetical protein
LPVHLDPLDVEPFEGALVAGLVVDDLHVRVDRALRLDSGAE